MKKINENTKVTLTLKQLKRLVKESLQNSDGSDVENPEWLNRYYTAMKMVSDAAQIFSELSQDSEAKRILETQFDDDAYKAWCDTLRELCADMDSAGENLQAELENELVGQTTVSEDDEGPTDMDAEIEELFDMYRACKVEPKVCNAIKADGEKTNIFLGRGNSVGGIARALRDGRLLKVIGFK